MNQDLFYTLILSSSFLALFGIAEFFYHFFKIQAEYTRKFVHIGTGLLTFLFPIFLNSHWWVLLLCSSFAFLLILSLKFKLLKSINAIDRESVGSLAYPVSVYLSFLAFEYSKDISFFYLPILILAFCDPIAALTGKKWPLGSFNFGKNSKSLMGTCMFFIHALILFFIFSLYFSNHHFDLKIIFEGLILASISAFTEAISGKGYDNLTIPLSVLVCLFMF